MIKKILLFLVISINLPSAIVAQENISNIYGVLASDIQLHNSVKYNRFIFNPVFSVVTESSGSVNIYNRNPRSSFNDNSKTYFLNYTSKVKENIGIGISLFQQNIGVFNYFGGTLNFAYNVKLSKEMNIAFGTNLNVSRNSIKSDIVLAQSSDEVINNYANNTIVIFSPGLNFTYSQFNVGLSIKNLVAYQLTDSEIFADNFYYTGHAMYKQEIDWKEDAFIEGMLYVSKSAELDVRYGMNVLFEIPKYGWLQVGYNSFYGSSIGVGVNYKKRISLGYTIEPGIGGVATASEFGATHEFGLAYNFDSTKKKKKSKSLKKKSEIDKLKKEVLEQNKLALDSLKIKSLDSLNSALVNQKESKKDTLPSTDIKDESLENKKLAKVEKQLEKTSDSLLTTSPELSRRDFNNLIKSLVDMNKDALKIKEEEKLEKSTAENIAENKEENIAENKEESKEENITENKEESKEENIVENKEEKIAENKEVKSEKKITTNNRFTKYASKERPKAKYARKYIPGYRKGYYLVGNVFTGGRYAKKFSLKLKEIGFEDSEIILNPNNKYEYVTLQYFKTKEEVDENYINNLGGKYYGEMWILINGKKKPKSKKQVAPTKKVTEETKPKTRVASVKKIKQETQIIKHEDIELKEIKEDEENLGVKKGTKTKETQKNEENLEVKEDVKTKETQKNEENLKVKEDAKTKETQKNEENLKVKEDAKTKETQKNKENVEVKEDAKIKETQKDEENVEVKEDAKIKETQKDIEEEGDGMVTIKKISHIEGHDIKNGYYLVNNVLKEESNLQQEIEALKAKGLESKYFKSPVDNFIYFYIEKFDNHNEAKESLMFNIVTYNGDLFILKIE